MPELHMETLMNPAEAAVTWVFVARELGEGIADFVHTIEAPSPCSSDREVVAAMEGVVTAFREHVRDGTKRGKEAWNALDPEVVARAWLDPQVLQRGRRRC